MLALEWLTAEDWQVENEVLQDVLKIALNILVSAVVTVRNSWRGANVK